MGGADQRAEHHGRARARRRCGHDRGRLGTHDLRGPDDRRPGPWSSGRTRPRPTRARRPPSTSPRGEQRDLVSPEPASGGSWALTDGDLYYPTYGEDRAYCLATAALADGNGEDGWCAEPRTGWSGLTASENGVALMTFDDARPVACRTLNLLDGSGLPQPHRGTRGLHRLGRRGHRGRSAVVRGAQAAPPGGGALLRLRRRHVRRPRPRHHRQRRPVRRLGLLRPRPAGRQRAGAADALDTRPRRSRSPTSRPRRATPSSANPSAVAAY